MPEAGDGVKLLTDKEVYAVINGLRVTANHCTEAAGSAEDAVAFVLNKQALAALQLADELEQANSVSMADQKIAIAPLIVGDEPDYIVRFLKAVYPEETHLALDCFNEEQAARRVLTDAAELIMRMRVELAELQEMVQ